MKSLKALFFVFVVFSLMFTSCSKSKDTASVNTDKAAEPEVAVIQESDNGIYHIPDNWRDYISADIPEDMEFGTWVWAQIFPGETEVPENWQDSFDDEIPEGISFEDFVWTNIQNSFTAALQSDSE